MPDAPVTTAAWPRWLTASLCAALSALLYHRLIRLTPKLVAARPTAVSDLLPWVKPLTLPAIWSIQHRKESLEYVLPFGIQYLLCCAALFLLYAAMLWAARGVQSRWFALFTGAMPAIFMAMLLASPAMLSSDTYAYSFYGRLLALYHVNAHAPAPAFTLADPYLCYGWKDWGPSRYGPLWTVISALPAMIGGPHIGLTLFLFRALGALSALACGLLIWAILNQLRPDRAALGLTLFLWNPLILIESAQSGHNDALMMAAALLAVWLHLRARPVAAALSLTLSALVKVITGPLVLLYLLFVARTLPDWASRARFLTRAGAAMLAAVALTMAATRMSPTGLLAHAAASPGFYMNNYQEIIFRGLRRMLGEQPNTLYAPMDFHIWWVATREAAVLHRGLSNKTPDLSRLATGHPLLALSDKDSDEWLRAYDPLNHQIGFIQWKHLVMIPPPVNAGSDPIVRQLSILPPDWPTVKTANRWIRIVSLSLFAAFGLLAAWRIRTFEDFLIWATLFFIVSMLLIFSQIWPWYAVWPLALGALIPASRPTLLAILLSAGLLSLYALLGYCNTHLEWIYDYRSLFAIVLPVAIFPLIIAATNLIKRRNLQTIS